MRALRRIPTGLLATPLVVAACMPSVGLVPGAQLVCAEDADCPRAMVCVVDPSAASSATGLCAEASSPCLTVDGVPVANGTRCEGGVCSAGICREPGCGDGIVDVGAGEECDVGADRVCREDCTVPLCGDGIVDQAESCDELTAACQECVFTCIVPDPGSEPSRRSNCNLDVSDGCECDLEYLLGEGGDDFAWKSAYSEGSIYFTHYTSSPELYRYRADADPPLLALAAAVSLAETGGGLFALVDGNRALARIVGDDLETLRDGLIADEGSDFAIHEDVLFVVTEDGVRKSSANGTDAPVTFTTRCDGLSDVVVCAEVLYCSSRESGQLIAIDVSDVGVGSAGSGDPGAQVIATFDLDNNTPTLLCHEDVLFVQDLGRLAAIVPGGALTELARFPAAGSNFGTNLTVDHDAPGNLFLTLGIGAAGPYAYLYELGTSRLTPVARGHALALADGVALTDDYGFTGGIAQVRVTRP